MITIYVKEVKFSGTNPFPKMTQEKLDQDFQIIIINPLSFCQIYKTYMKILYLPILIIAIIPFVFAQGSSVACKEIEQLTDQQLWTIVKVTDFDRYFIMIVGSISVFGLILTLLTWILFRSFSSPSDVMLIIVIAELIENSASIASASYITANKEAVVAPANFQSACIAIGVFNIIGYSLSMYYNILFCAILAYSIRNTLKGGLINQKVYHIASVIVVILILGATILNQNLGVGLHGACGFRAANRQSIARIILEIFLCGLAFFCMIIFKKKIPKNSYFQKQAIFGYYYYYIGFFAFSQLLVSISFLIGNISCRGSVSFSTDIIRISFTVGNCLTLVLSYILIILRFSHPILRAKIKKLLFDRQNVILEDIRLDEQNQIEMKEMQNQQNQRGNEQLASSRKQFRELTRNLSSILPNVNDEDNSWLGCLLQSIKGSQILSFLVGIMMGYAQVERSLGSQIEMLCEQKGQARQRLVASTQNQQKIFEKGQQREKSLNKKESFRSTLKKWKGLNQLHFNRFYQLSMNEDITDQFISTIANDQYNLLVKKKLDGLRTLNYQVTQYFPEAFYIMLKCQKQLNVLSSFELQKNISTVKKQSYTNGGKSGQFFFATFDHKFFFKTIQNYECESYMQRAKQFYEYFTANPASLLVKILGLYRFTRQDIKDKPVYLIMMKNLSLSSRQRNYRVYDIKGSEFNRSTMNEKKIKWNQQEELRKYTLKDQDFLRIERKIQIRQEVALQLKSVLKKDIQFLGQLGVMDYSLLIIKRKGYKSSNTGLQQIPSLNDGEVYNFGIIDYLQSWNLKRKAQRILKSLATDKQITAQDPFTYAQRLSNFLDVII